MTNRDLGSVLAAVGAVAAAMSRVAGNHLSGLAGLSHDFWQGVPLGIALVLIIAAAVLVLRSTRTGR